MIASEAQFGAVTHHPREQIEVLAVNKAAPVMPGFWPWIWKEQKNPIEHRRRKQRQQGPHIFVKNADVGEARFFDKPRQGGDAIAKRFAAEKPDVRMGRRLRGQVFAGAKTDLEPNRRAGRKQSCRIAICDVCGCDPESIEDRLKPCTATWTKGMAATPPVEMGLVGGLGAWGVSHPLIRA